MNLYFFILGFSLGLIIQVLVIAVQNTVDYADLGAATSGVTFFRSIGGSFGVSVFGAIFTNQLVHNLSSGLHGVPLPPGFSPAAIHGEKRARQAPGRCPARHPARVQPLAAPGVPHRMPIALVAFVLSWFLREVPLRTVAGATLRESAKATDLAEGMGTRQPSAPHRRRPNGCSLGSRPPTCAGSGTPS